MILYLIYLEQNYRAKSQQKFLGWNYSHKKSVHKLSTYQINGTTGLPTLEKEVFQTCHHVGQKFSDNLIMNAVLHSLVQPEVPSPPTCPQHSLTPQPPALLTMPYQTFTAFPSKVTGYKLRN